MVVWQKPKAIKLTYAETVRTKATVEVQNRLIMNGLNPTNDLDETYDLNKVDIKKEIIPFLNHLLNRLISEDQILFHSTSQRISIVLTTPDCEYEKELIVSNSFNIHPLVGL